MLSKESDDELAVPCLIDSLRIGGVGGPLELFCNWCDGGGGGGRSLLGRGPGGGGGGCDGLLLPPPGGGGGAFLLWLTVLIGGGGGLPSFPFWIVESSYKIMNSY